MRNNADTLVYQTEKTMKELGDKVSDADKKTLEEKVAAVKKALEGTDFEAIKSATEALTSSSYEVFGKAYSTATADQGAAGRGRCAAGRYGREGRQCGRRRLRSGGRRKEISVAYRIGFWEKKAVFAFFFSGLGENKGGIDSGEQGLL